MKTIRVLFPEMLAKQTMMWQRVKIHPPKNNKSIQGLLDAMRNMDLKRKNTP